MHSFIYELCVVQSLKRTIFSSCAGGFRRKIQRGAKKMSTIPMMVITHGKPMVSAMDPPIDGPAPGGNTADVAFFCFELLLFHLFTFLVLSQVNFMLTSV